MSLNKYLPRLFSGLWWVIFNFCPSLQSFQIIDRLIWNESFKNYTLLSIPLCRCASTISCENVTLTSCTKEWYAETILNCSILYLYSSGVMFLYEKSCESPVTKNLDHWLEATRKLCSVSFCSVKWRAFEDFIWGLSYFQQWYRLY